MLTLIFRHSYVRRFGTSLVDSSRIPELSKAYNSALASITLRFIDDDSARNDLCESESAQMIVTDLLIDVLACPQISHWGLFVASSWSAERSKYKASHKCRDARTGPSIHAYKLLLCV